MGPREAVITPSGRTVAPFGDAASATPILNRPLGAWQQDALAAAGLTVVATPTPGQPYVALSDRTWLTPALLKRFVERARPGQRFQLDHAGLWEHLAPLQQLERPGLFELAVLPAGAAPAYAGLDALPVAVDVEAVPPTLHHPALAFAMPSSIPLTHQAILQVDHWSHVLRANWLALAAHFQQRRVDFRALPLPRKLWMLARILWRARSLRRGALAAAITRRGRNCVVHPTAVVEASVLGDNVTVGAFAVVRGSWLGNGVVLEEHAVVKNSVLGDGSLVGLRGFANLCVTHSGALLSTGDGHQASVFGKDAFVAWGCVLLDLSFGKDITVTLDGQRVSAGTRFLGAAVGHRARLGSQVQLGYGAEVPNDAFVVGPSSAVLRAWGPGEDRATRRVVDGVAALVPPRG